MADVPLCLNPKCRRPMTYLGEDKGCYCFGCYSCGSQRVITTPRTKEAARHQKALERRAAAETLEHANPNRRYSFGKR